MKFFKYLPKFIRIKLIRQNIKILASPEGFQVKIASTQEELEKSFSLLHDCYVGNKLMRPDASGIRCGFYSFLPNTTTVVAKIGDAVVGTVSLIKDSSAGLPSDKDFKRENDKLRKEGHALVEVSALATDPNYRNKAHVVSLYLMKYLRQYTTHHMGCTTVVCVIHPRARDFYSAFWGFKSNRKIVKYKFVNDALGAHAYGVITDESLKRLSKFFPKSVDRNPIEFCFKEESVLKYPERNIQSCLDPVFTPDLLKYFMSEKTQEFKNLSQSELAIILSAYSLFFDKLDNLDLFKSVVKSGMKKKQFRFPTEIHAYLYSSVDATIPVKITNITQDGAFIEVDSKLDMNREYFIEFNLGTIRISGGIKICWENNHIENKSHVGYGVKFNQTQLGVTRMLKQTHLASTQRVA